MRLNSMSSSSQALAALHALFEPVAPLEPDAPELPRNLDDSITADAATAWDFVTHRWYRGVDTQGVVRIFRFQRGLSLAQWHEALQSQRLQSVDGPFRTQVQAQAQPR